MDLQDKSAVITGGASGVGRSLAFALGRRGVRVAIADVDRDALNSVLRELEQEDIRAIAEYCDVGSSDGCNQLAQKVFEQFGAVHFVFANAGISPGEAGPMWEYSRKDWKWAFRVNLWGVIHSINAFMPRLIAQGEEAHFCITGSGNGALVILQDCPIYTTSKAAVHAITENLFQQVSAMDTPVRVHALMPGPHIVETGLFDSERVRPQELQKPGQKKDSGIHSADDMRRMADEMGLELQFTHPDEVAKMALHNIEQGKFWLMEISPENRARISTRTERILQLQDPAPQHAGN